ncbi:MAG: tetratricopeptide repeat protein [Agriterribacter sp.]
MTLILRTALSIFIIIICQTVVAQQAALDSLSKALEKHPAEDTIRLNILNEIVYAYHTSDPDKGLETADRAIQLATKLKYPVKLAGSYSNKGINYWSKGEDSLALNMYQKALSIHSAAGNKSGVAKMYNNIGLLYFNKSSYYEAVSYHQKALEIFTTLKDTSRLAGALNNIGVDYQYLAEYPKALDYFFKALTIYEKSGDPQSYGTGQANAYSNIGIIYKNLEKYDNALEYHQKALNIYEKLNNQQGIAATYGNMGVVYDKLLQPEKAINYYQKALSINEISGNPRRIASDLSNIGVAYIELKNYEKALDYLERTLALYKQADDKSGISMALSEIGEIYREAPASLLRQKKIDPTQRTGVVINYQQQSLQLAKEIGALDRQAEILKGLSDIYEQNGDAGKALSAYKEYLILKDSILDDEKKVAIAKRESAFEFDKKEALLNAEHDKQFALANAEIHKQRIIRNSVLIGIIVLLAAAVTGYILYKRKRDAEEQQKEAEFKVQVTDTEMKALRAQMNPHFIFNSLNSIADYITKNDISAADVYLTKFSRLMRLILENSDKKEVPLEDDLHALELYIQLEAKRLNNKFTYEIKIDPAIDKETTLVPPLLLQPFVENSIWHGFAQKKGNGKLMISIVKENDMINCMVEDNGIGRQKSGELKNGSANQKGKSLGMKITTERIQILNQTKKTNAGVTIHDLAQGVRAEVRLPLELAY